MSADARIAARAPLDALLGVMLASLGLTLANTASMALIDFGVSSLDFWKVVSWAWLALGLAQLGVSWWLLQAFRGHRAAGPMWWAATLVTIEAALQVMNVIAETTEWRGYQEAMGPLAIRFVWVALAYAVQVLTFLALWRWSGGRHPMLAVAFWGTFAMGALVTSVRVGLPKETMLAVMREWRWPFIAVTTLVSACRSVVMGAVVLVARSGAGTEAAAAPSVGVETSPRGPVFDLVLGIFLLVVGLGVTVLSISIASKSGGRMIFATGSIVVGVVRIIRGLGALGQAKSARSPLDPPEGP